MLIRGMSANNEAPILIAGGGLVGCCAALARRLSVTAAGGAAVGQCVADGADTSLPLIATSSRRSRGLAPTVCR